MKQLITVISLLALFAGCKESGPKEKPASYTRMAYVNATSGLRMRDKPTVSAKKLATIPGGIFIKIDPEAVKEETIGNKTAKWYRVTWNSRQGYSFGAHLVPLDERLTLDSRAPEIEATEYSGGIECDGLTYSEYSCTLKFENGKLTYSTSGAAGGDCEPKTPSEPIGYGLTYTSSKFGTYAEKGKFITGHFTRSQHDSEEDPGCKNPKKSSEKKNINERITLYPVICSSGGKKIKAFIIPNMADFYTHIWVPKKKDEKESE